jgi:hypothetical protein
MPILQENVYVAGGKVTTEGITATYGIAGAGNTPAPTPTDVFILNGSATKTVKIKRITVSGLATTAGTMSVSLVKRTTANTGGTSTAPSIALFDSKDAAATAVPKLYTANPSALGTGITLSTQSLNFGVAGAAANVVFDFSTRNDKAIYLRGVAEGLAINLNGGAVPSGGTFGYTIEFEETV